METDYCSKVRIGGVFVGYGGLMSWLLLICCVLFGDGVGQCWIATAIGAGLGVLSSLYGGSKAAQEAKKAERELDRAEAEGNAWYSRRYNQGYKDTAAGQSLLTTARDMAQENWKRAEGARRVAGASGASSDRAKEQGVKMVGTAINQMAVNDTARKDAADMAHRADQKAITTQRMGIHNNRAAQITAAASQASNALIGAGAALDSARSLKGVGTRPAAKTPEEALERGVKTAVPTTNAGYVSTMYDYEENPNRWMFDDLT